MVAGRARPAYRGRIEALRRGVQACRSAPRIFFWILVRRLRYTIPPMPHHLSRCHFVAVGGRSYPWMQTGGSMSTYMHPATTLEAKSAKRVLKTGDDERRSEGRSHVVAVPSAEDSGMWPAVPTLDDFGGRSDALGG
jgi:hypothetical protein